MTVMMNIIKCINYPYYETVMVRSGSTVFPIRGRNTGDCVNWLKTQLDDVYISNIFLGKNARSKSHLLTHVVPSLMSLSSVRLVHYVTSSESWPIIGVINPNSFTDTTDEIEVEAGEI